MELLEDSDVKAERSKVMGMKLNEETFKKYPLLIRNIRKKYATGKIANKAMCLAVEEHIVFGLLGPVSSLHAFLTKKCRMVLANQHL